MALGNVFMTDIDGNIGSAVTSNVDEVCGLIFDVSAQADFWTAGPGLAVASKLKDTIVEINSLDDAVKLGITPYDETGASTNALLSGIPYYHISHFFSMAGGTGRLFISFADCKSNWNPILDMQRASGGIISQFGVWTEQRLWKKMDELGSTYTINIVGDLETIGKQMANDYHAPACILLSANSAKVTQTSGDVDTIAFSEIADSIINARYVSVLLSQSADTAVRKMQGSLKSTTPVGVVGLALGALTRASVGESIGWVQRFDLVAHIPAIEMGFGNSAISNGMLTNSTAYSALTKAQMDELDEKGYIFMRTYEGLEGHVYFTKDRSCSKGDYCSISRNRTINKSRRLVRQALLPYVNSPVKVDPANGNLSAAQITIYTNLITDCLQSMVNAEEVSAIGKVVIPANQNILKTKTLKFKYTLIPLGTAESIEVEEGLAISR